MDSRAVSPKRRGRKRHQSQSQSSFPSQSQPRSKSQDTSRKKESDQSTSPPKKKTKTKKPSKKAKKKVPEEKAPEAKTPEETAPEETAPKEKPPEEKVTEPPKPPPLEPYTFKLAFKKSTELYLQDSTIHGVPYLAKRHGTPLKIFWLCLIFISFILCVIMTVNQYIRLKRTPVIVSFSERATDVSHIPFPAVTICSETKSIKNEKINFTRFYLYLKSHGNEVIRQPPWLNDSEFRNMRALLQVCGNELVIDMKFPEYPPINVEDNLNQINPPFVDQFIDCHFNQTVGDCVPFFEKIYTQEGICYTFNSLNESEIYRENTYQYEYFKHDLHVKKRNETLAWEISKGYKDPDNYKTFPERVIGCGLRSGLNVGLEQNEHNLDFVCRGPVQGFKVILHSPDDVPQVDKHFIQIPYLRDVLISVKPQYLYTTNDIESFTPEDRNCYYPHERKLQFFQYYTQNNCEIECLANFTLLNCGCVKFSMPRLQNTAVCDASKITCYDQAEYDFLFSEYTGLKHLKKCICLPGCFTLNYNHELSEGIFNMEKIIESLDHNFYGSHREGSMVSRIRINFKMNEFTANKRSELISLTDFFANCGGLFGLFMGISVLSIVELFYHFTFRLHAITKIMKENRRHIHVS